MADNRIFLIHQPTCLGVLIGKRRYSWGYPYSNENPLIEFYSMISNSGEGVDNIILFNEETNYGEPWEYTSEIVNGFRLFKRKENVT